MNKEKACSLRKNFFITWRDRDGWMRTKGGREGKEGWRVERRKEEWIDY